jgi:multimeric flavodoxin WrbA
MPKVVVIYHSGYGHTQRMAQSVAEGAGAELVAIDADGNLPEGGWETLNAADAIIMGSPTYMGNVSWQFKKFADASSKPWYAQAWKDKLFAGFTNSAAMSGDKMSTLNYLFTWPCSMAASGSARACCPATARRRSATTPTTWALTVALSHNRHRMQAPAK